MPPDKDWKFAPSFDYGEPDFFVKDSQFNPLVETVTQQEARIAWLELLFIHHVDSPQSVYPSLLKKWPYNPSPKEKTDAT